VKVVYRSYRLLDGKRKKLIQRIGDGSIITRFDKTPMPIKSNDVLCPHFMELKWAYGCPFDCAWCYLKGTFRFRPSGIKPVIKDLFKVYTHVSIFLNNVKTPEILNTGEIADSLMAENSRRSFSKRIIPLFEEQHLHKVLFLTKSTHIENLLSIKRHKQTIISYSLNAPYISRKWERRAPSVIERIAAAEKLVDSGYEVRIRIDPMVPVKDWSQRYIELVDMIFERLRPSRITLGSLRGLQSTLNVTRDHSWKHYLNENSNWGKKIDFSTRYQMYRLISGYLRDKWNYRRVSFCKETVAMWKKLRRDYKKIKCNCTW